jgi:hypothetical protein
MGIDVVLMLGQVIGELEESRASRTGVRSDRGGNRGVGGGRNGPGTERGIVPHCVATETTYVGEESAVRTSKGTGGSGLCKRSARNHGVASIGGPGGGRTLFVEWSLVVVE